MSDAIITKKALAQAFITLMEKKPFNKITISEIVSSCHLKRQTFYYHFEDKYALVYWLFQQDINDLTLLIKEETTADHVLQFCTYFQSQREFYRNLFMNGDKRILRDMIFQKLYDKFYDELACYESEDNQFRDFVSNYVAIGTSGILFQWLMNENHQDIETFADYLYRIHHQIMTDFINICEKQTAS